MRFVDLAMVKPPADWEKKVAKAKAALAGKIDDHSEVWRCCKGNLRDASNKKCFYCEMKDIRSDGTVDHYRPKSKYQWAAFRFGNFRFACTFCNSKRTDRLTGEKGGKGNEFPLHDETKRAKCEADEALEIPLLLDPCEAGDPDFLDFDKSGSAVPKFSEDEDCFNFARADKSIKLYHLNESELVEARAAHAITLLEKIIDAERALSRMQAGEGDAVKDYNSTVRDLKRAISPEAEMSVFSRRVVQGHRNKKLVDAVIASA